MNESDTMHPQRVDTRDMIVVHTALLREIRLAPAAVASPKAMWLIVCIPIVLPSERHSGCLTPSNGPVSQCATP